MVALNLAGTSPAPRDTHQLVMTIRDAYGWHSSETHRDPCTLQLMGGFTEEERVPECSIGTPAWHPKAPSSPSSCAGSWPDVPTQSFLFQCSLQPAGQVHW